MYGRRNIAQDYFATPSPHSAALASTDPDFHRQFGAVVETFRPQFFAVLGGLDLGCLLFSELRPLYFQKPKCQVQSRTSVGDPNRSYGEAGFAEAVDNLFEILRVLIERDLAPLID